MKNARAFRREQRKGLDSFREATQSAAYIVYRGDRELDLDGIRVVPLKTFLRRLHAGEIIG